MTIKIQQIFILKVLFQTVTYYNTFYITEAIKDDQLDFTGK